MSYIGLGTNEIALGNLGVGRMLEAVGALQLSYYAICKYCQRVHDSRQPEGLCRQAKPRMRRSGNRCVGRCGSFTRVSRWATSPGTNPALDYFTCCRWR